MFSDGIRRCALPRHPGMKIINISFLPVEIELKLKSHKYYIIGGMFQSANRVKLSKNIQIVALNFRIPLIYSFEHQTFEAKRPLRVNNFSPHYI